MAGGRGRAARVAARCPSRPGSCFAPGRSTAGTEFTVDLDRRRLAGPGRQAGALGPADRLQQRRGRRLPRRPAQPARRGGAAGAAGGRGGRHGAHRPRRRRGRLRLPARRSRPAPSCWAVGARTCGSRRPVPAAQRRRAIDEAFPDRGEGEARADVARRLTAGEGEEPAGLGLGRVGGLGRRRPGGGPGEPASRDSRQARRVVVKVGSSSLTTAAGGIDPGRVKRPRGRPRCGPGRGVPRWCWSPPVRSRPGCRRSGWPAARATWPASRRPPRSGRGS